MTITAALLESAMGARRDLTELYAPHLAAACAAYEINTPLRLAHFLAQLGHESGALIHVREIWGPTPAQERYEGRVDLGNTQAGDGRRYMGRGLLQTTGRSNHRSLRDRLRAKGLDAPDFEAAPELLEQPRWAALSATDYWGMRGINRMADRDDHEAVTRAVNGGVNGLEDRRRRLVRAKAALGAVQEAPTPPTQAAPAREPWQSDDPGQYSQEAGMPIPAIIGALLPSVVAAIPELAKIFKPGSEVAERNVAAATAVMDIVTKATNSVNAQAAVEAIQKDPAALAAATKAVERDWFELHKAAEQSTEAARAFSVTYAEKRDVRTVMWNLTFLEVLSLLLVLSTLGGGMAVLIWGGIDAQLKGAVVTLMLIGGFTGVTNFWFGSSLGSKKKDDAPVV